VDTIRTETPESVAILHTPAGLGSRLAAALIDAAIQAGAGLGLLFQGFMTAAIGAEFGFNLTGGVALALVVLLAAGVFFCYPLFFEMVWRGQTPGKRVLGLRVTRVDGLPAEFSRLAVRNLLRIVDMLPLTYGVGILAMLLTRRSQRLGDLAAGTVVVRLQPAALPDLPTELSRPFQASPVALRQHLARLSDQDLEPVRAFWSRRNQLEPLVRTPVARRLAEAVAAACGWPEPIPDAEAFLEEVLVVRHGRVGIGSGPTAGPR